MENDNIKSFIEILDQLLDKIIDFKEKNSVKLESIGNNYKVSAYNLLAYTALRNTNISALQLELAELGLSSLGRAESHVVANLLSVRKLLAMLINDSSEVVKFDTEWILNIEQSKNLLRRNTEALFGERPMNREVYVMVTLSSDIAQNYEKVKQLLFAGMNCARINCAHDDESAWLKMIENIKKARTELGVNCKILMDLGGPKLRTGLIKKGPPLLKVKPTKDNTGRIITPAKLVITSRKDYKNLTIPVLYIKKDFSIELSKDDIIEVRDYNDKKIEIRIVNTIPEGYECELKKSAYLTTGNKLKIKRKDKVYHSVVAELPNLEQAIVLKIGDQLVLKANQKEGQNAKLNKDGSVSVSASISCSLPEIFEDLKPGEKILLNDGNIGGIIVSVSNKIVIVKITDALENGSTLKGDKGINFPESSLKIKGLMPKDKEDLVFVVKHAEIVNMSFVSNPEDINDLFAELVKLNARDIGVMLKIETQKGFNNITNLLLSAMQKFPVGIMIARGDLAPEVGWVRLAEIQEEMLWFCEAAHIPVVWATQVLENLAQKGIPTRAEITDAAMGQRAECVMLNKGEFILKAVEMLDEILASMKFNQYKKSHILRKLSVSDI